MIKIPEHGKTLNYDSLIQELESVDLLGPRSADRVISVKQERLAKQFIPFQLVAVGEKNEVRMLDRMEPAFDGTEEEPDLLLRVEMVDFHLGESDQADINPNTRVTMNMSIQQENAIDQQLEPLYWVASTGIDLYKMFKEGKADEKGPMADFHEAFGRRPIEIPDGAAILKFDVIKHKEPRWWEYVFSAFRSKAGQSLVSIIGLPGVALQAVNAIEGLVRRIDDQQQEILFASESLSLILTKKAKERRLGDGAISRVGALRPGLFILARGKDYKLMKEQAPFYHYTYKRLFPASATDEDMVDPYFPDPFAECTFAVFRIGMKATKLHPAYEELNF